MYKHARRPEPRENPIGQIANALRGAARKHHHIAGCECAMHRRFGLSLVVRKGAVMHRLAAGFLNGGAHDRAIAVIDAGRRQRRAGWYQLVAGREHGQPSAAAPPQFLQYHRRPGYRFRAS